MKPQMTHRPTRRQYLSITNIFVTTPVFLFATSVNAIPALTAVLIQTQIPKTHTVTTTYTVTKISSTTLTTFSPVLHISPHILELITTMTVTTYEPWPAFPSPWPGVSLNQDQDDGKWPATWSTTVLEEVVSSITWVERRRYLDIGNLGDVGDTGSIKERGEREKDVEERVEVEETTITTFAITKENTWVIHPAGPTGVFLQATVGGEVGCGGCDTSIGYTTASGSRLSEEARTGRRESRQSGEQFTAPEQQAVGEKRNLKQKHQSSLKAPNTAWTEAEVFEEDPVCKASGLATGCQGQCLWKPLLSPSLHPFTIPNITSLFPSQDTVTGLGSGSYWCLHIHPHLYSDPSLRMGRACWGSYLRYRQLNKPCLVGDVGMACLPCENGVPGGPEGGEGGIGQKDEGWDAVFWEGEE